MWFHNCVFYQIYPLNFCGAPELNSGVQEHRLDRITDYMDRYLSEYGIGGVYLNPVFSSDTHGYDTRDYRRIDERLGTNEEFRKLVNTAHKRGIRVVLDGVFHHVGRGFFAFQDLIQKGFESRYKDWFCVDFNGNSPYDDGFWYEGWEGHYELVKLNLYNPEVQNYLLDSIGLWLDEFQIDGIRLDVAYLLPDWFMAKIREYVSSRREDFFLVGETLADNQGHLFTEGKLDSITDYPLYNSIWSGFNSRNMFEIAHTLKRNLTEMYPGRALWSFLDNHDVDRIAGKLTDPELLTAAFGLQMALPGIPCIYYGSEWGIEGRKRPGQSDRELRPEIVSPEYNDLSEQVKEMVRLRNCTPALMTGSFREVLLTNQQYVFLREAAGSTVLTAINISDSTWEFQYDLPHGTWSKSLSQREEVFEGTLQLGPKSITWWIF